MEMILERNASVTAGTAGADGRLSVTGAATLFLDLAEQHADLLGFGVKALMEQGLFWVTSKTMIRVEKAPLFGERILVQTWPLAPGRVTTERHYRISSEGGALVTGKTVWVMVDAETGRPAKAGDVMSGDLDYLTEVSCEGQFPRILYREEDFSDLAEYAVTSSDIDIGGHMNNVAYLRAMSGCFSSAELREHPVKEVCVVYLSPCYEGERIRFRIRRDGTFSDVAAVKEDGTVAALFRMEHGA